MEIPTSLSLIACPIALLVFLGLAIGLGLLIRDTLRRNGKWGINLNPVFCPGCGEPAPILRTPLNRRQAMWGGQICAKCGTQFDKWGHPLPKPDHPTSE